MTIYTIDDINFQAAFDAMPSQDPEISTRFYLPIPNWAADNSIPKADPIKDVPKKGVCYTFYNKTDAREQRAAIDGTDTIVFKTPYAKACQLLAWIQANIGENIGAITPEDVTKILSHAKTMGIDDIYNASLEKVLRTMHPVSNAPQTGKDGYGSYLPNPHVSAAIYIPGAGSYIQYPGAAPQVFENGGYISFPGLDAQTLRTSSVEHIVELATQKAIGIPRQVQANIFENDCTMPDGSKIAAGKRVASVAASRPEPREDEIPHDQSGLNRSLFELTYRWHQLTPHDINMNLENLTSAASDAKFNIGGSAAMKDVQNLSRESVCDMALAVFDNAGDRTEWKVAALVICSQLDSNFNNVHLAPVLARAITEPGVSEHAQDILQRLPSQTRDRILGLNDSKQGLTSAPTFQP